MLDQPDTYREMIVSLTNLWQENKKKEHHPEDSFVVILEFYWQQIDKSFWIQCMDFKIWFHENYESSPCLIVIGLYQECVNGSKLLVNEYVLPTIHI